MEKNKPIILRPVAWIAIIIMMFGLQYVAELICLLGGYLIDFLNGLSLAVIVIIVVFFGGVFTGIYFYSAIMLPALAVTISDKIYPSNHAFRYYFVGLYEIAGCALLVFLGITGQVDGGPMFWFYARYIWLILASICMMITGNNTAKERHILE